MRREVVKGTKVLSVTANWGIEREKRGKTVHGCEKRRKEI